MDRITIGVVGLGVGRLFLSPYLEASARVRLVVCDLDGDLVNSTRSEFPGIAAGYTSLEEMLNREEPGAVNLMVPDHLHRALAEKCLDAGCHVMLTKPMATTVEDARAIVEAARKSGRKVMVAQESRLRPRVAKIRELIESGKIGDILHIQSDFIGNKRRQFTATPWYASAEAGRTAMVGSAIHNVDLIRYLVGKPIQSVFAFGDPRGELEFAGNKTVSASYRFEGGAIGTVAVSYVAADRAGGTDNMFRLIGTKGIIVGSTVGYERIAERESLEEFADSSTAGIRRCSELFLNALLEDAPVAVTPEDAFDSVAACVAADESCASGQPVAPQEL